MTVTVTFAKQAEIFRIELDIIENILFYVIRRLITKYKFAKCGTRIGKVKIKTVLMAVQCHDSQFIGILCEAYTRNISICIQWEFHCTGDM